MNNTTTAIINNTADVLSGSFSELIQTNDEVLDALMQAAIFFVGDLNMFDEEAEAELAAALVARVCVTNRL